MHRFKAILIQFTLFLLLSTPLLAHVALDNPLGGETFVEGQTIVIRWHIVAEHETLNWDLLFSSNGGADWEPILMNIQLDSLTYTWVIPSVFSSQCRVRVIQDNTGQDYYGTSEDFTIIPNTSAPSIDAPAQDLNMDCDLANQEMAIQAWLDNHGGAVATNYCSELIWTHDYNGLSDGCGATGSALVVFTATDDCGSTYTVATVAVTDQQPPVLLNWPTDTVVSCDGQGNTLDFDQWIQRHGGAMASDACGNIVWTQDIPAIGDSCGWSGSRNVTFFATDDCGNSISATAQFEIVDMVSPVITKTAHDTLLDCSAANQQSIQQWLDQHGGAEAEDLCGNVSWTHDYSGLMASCGNTGSANVTFVVMDECGNSTTTSATLTVIDTIGPIIMLEAQDTLVVCNTPGMSDVIQSWLHRQGSALASDACGNVAWSNNAFSLANPCVTDTFIFTFTAMDECGNQSTSQATLMIIDTTSVHQETTVFAPIGTTWYYSESSFGPPWQTNPLFGYYFVEKDTFLLGRQAITIGWYSNNEGILERVDSLTKFISVNGDQVNYKVGNEFVLLYDFGAEPGDTIHSKVESSDLSLGCISSFEEEVIDFRYVIDSISTMFIDGEELRIQFVTTIIEDDNDQWGFQTNMLIERMGYAGWGGFWWGQGLACIFETGYLRCYEDPDISWRHPDFSEHLSCDYVSRSADPDIISISMYPNPTNGIVYLPEGADHIEVFSIEGSQTHFTRNGNEIDLGECPAGMYVIRLTIEEWVYVGRVVLQK